MRPPLDAPYGEARERFFAAVSAAIGNLSGPDLYRLAAIGEEFYAGRFAETLRRLEHA
jgi:hypothetical protein